VLVGRSNRTLRGKVRTRKSERDSEHGSVHRFENRGSDIGTGFGISELRKLEGRRRKGDSERELGFLSFPTERGVSDWGFGVRCSWFQIGTWNGDRKFGDRCGNRKVGSDIGVRNYGFRVFGSEFRNGLEDRVFEGVFGVRGSEFRIGFSRRVRNYGVRNFGNP